MKKIENMEDIEKQPDVHVGFYYTDLIYSKGTIILYYDSSKKCFQFLYSQKRIGNFGYVLCPIIFVFDKNRNIIAYHSIYTLSAGDFELSNGCRISCEFENEMIYFYINNKRLLLSKAEYLIAKRAFVENAINKAPSYISLLRKQDACFEKLHEYVNQLDIDEILSSLEISISESFISKIGGDDRYYVERTTSSTLNIVQSDSYLQEFLKIGSDTIYSESSYRSAYDMALPNLKTGKLQGEKLLQYLDELKSSYSKEDHMYYLLKNWIRTNIREVFVYKEKMQNLLYEIDCDFARLYHLDFYKTGYLDKFGVSFTYLDRHYLFQALDTHLHSFEKMSEKIDEINTYIYKYSNYITQLNKQFKSELKLFK